MVFRWKEKREVTEKTRGKTESDKQKQRKQESCHVPPPFHGFTLVVYLGKRSTPSSGVFLSVESTNDNEIHQGTILTFLCRPIRPDVLARAWKKPRGLKPSNRWTSVLNRNRGKWQGWLLSEGARNAFNGPDGVAKVLNKAQPHEQDEGTKGWGKKMKMHRETISRSVFALDVLLEEFI